MLQASVIVTSSLTHLITQGSLDLQPATVSTPAAPAARTTVQPAAPAETLYNETENLGNRGREGALRLGLDFQLCPLLNISYCLPTHHPIPHGTTLVIAAYNPLGWARDEIIRIPPSLPPSPRNPFPLFLSHHFPLPALPFPPFSPSRSSFPTIFPFPLFLSHHFPLPALSFPPFSPSHSSFPTIFPFLLLLSHHFPLPTLPFPTIFPFPRSLSNPRFAIFHLSATTLPATPSHSATHPTFQSINLTGCPAHHWSLASLFLRSCHPSLVSSPAVIVTDAHGNTVPSQAIPEALVPWETRERYINVQMGGESVKRGEERVGGGEEENQGREVREQQQQQQQQQQLEEQQNQQQNQQQQQKKKKKKQQQQKRQQQKQQNKQQNQQQQQQQQQGVVVSVVFRAKVPPLGYSTFFLSPASPKTPGAAVQSTEWQAQVQPGGGGGEWGEGEEAGEGKEEGGRGEEGKEGKEGGEEGEGLEREGVMVDEEGEGVGGGDVIVLGGWDGAASGLGGGAAEVDGAVAGSVGDVATAGAAGVASDGEGGTAPGSTAPGSSNAQSGSSQTALRVLFSKGAYGLARLQLLARNQQGGETVLSDEQVGMGMGVYISKHAAGAYIFNPPHAATSAQNMSQQVPIRVLRGPLVEEFHRALAPWLSEVGGVGELMGGCQRWAAVRGGRLSEVGGWLRWAAGRGGRLSEVGGWQRWAAVRGGRLAEVGGCQ
ncbi:unnamed protein product, partial [Closterium sp. NIES-53]